MPCSRPRRKSTRGSNCPTRAACTCFASSRASVISLRWPRLLPWLITAACFAYLGVRLERAAAADGQRLLPYLAASFAHVAWSRWLMLMIPYCVVFLLVDSLVVWRVTGWFNARLRYRDVLPIRASASILVIVHLFFRGRIGAGLAVRERPIFRAFRMAKLRHYAAVLALRSPAMLAAVVVYAMALRLFGVTVGVVEMLGYLPVIFFGAATPGPMHSVAIVLWVVLFPERPGEMTTFGFVQHNFFVLFNAAVGLLFLRQATRELFATAA